MTIDIKMLSVYYHNMGVDQGQNQEQLANFSRRDISNYQSSLVDQGKLAEAERAIKEWQQNTSHTPEGDKDREITYLELARTQFWQGKLQEARATMEPYLGRVAGGQFKFTEGIASEHQSDWINSFVGQLQVASGNYESAEGFFKAAQKRNPDNHEAKLFLEFDSSHNGHFGELQVLLDKQQLSPRERIRVRELSGAMDFDINIQGIKGRKMIDSSRDRKEGFKNNTYPRVRDVLPQVPVPHRLEGVVNRVIGFMRK